MNRQTGLQKGYCQIDTDAGHSFRGKQKKGVTKR
jgi:hypothetical protein